MTERVGVACLVLMLAASFAVAQDTTSEDGGFCATAPQELLVALDGSWTMTQGPGVAVGAFPIPLPGHPPVAMRLEYDPEGGFTILSGQGQQMLMVPMVTETASRALGKDSFDVFATETEGLDACEWYALPTLVGSNAYALSGTVGYDQITFVDDSAYNGFLHVAAALCVGDTLVGVGVMEAEGGLAAVPFGDTGCEESVMRSAGDMLMTIALKFDSMSSARGTLTFTGESQGYSFAAWAPITMSR